MHVPLIVVQVVAFVRCRERSSDQRPSTDVRPAQLHLHHLKTLIIWLTHVDPVHIVRNTVIKCVVIISVSIKVH